MGKLLLFRLRPSLCTGINLPKVSENRRNLWCINNENRVDVIQELHELPMLSLSFKYQHIGLIKRADIILSRSINDFFICRKTKHAHIHNSYYVLCEWFILSRSINNLSWITHYSLTCCMTSFWSLLSTTSCIRCIFSKKWSCVFAGG